MAILEKKTVEAKRVMGDQSHQNSEVSDDSLICAGLQSCVQSESQGFGSEV
jgi:hypothetical protein